MDEARDKEMDRLMDERLEGQIGGWTDGSMLGPGSGVKRRGSSFFYQRRRTLEGGTGATC